MRSGKNQRFEALVMACADDMYRFALWLCRDDAVAQDLVQETTLRAWRSLDNLRDGAAVKPWLFTILRREHARLYERKRLQLVELDERVPENAGWADPERCGDIDDIREAMLKLPQKYREPLLLQVLGGLSCAEIAAELGEQPGAVMTQLHRARHKLKAILLGDTEQEADHGVR